MKEPPICEEAALRDLIAAAFGERPDPPTITLRGSNALDDYGPPAPWDAALDTPDAAYLEENCWGQHHLDPASWRHYLPILMRHALDRFRDHAPSPSTDTLLFSLRPPDRVPPRFATLSPEQEAAVLQFLDLLAFDPRSTYTDDAMTALEEYWAPGATYR
ncbi:hypothetical protein JI752_005995 [Lysobacter sp. MMG2]|uniref:DUF6714 family protein n=1 Tax=Lysobacter sp. MMG2 TaxID=2801338 RepID=UPI001C2507E5|nr:DUF6714 family protein [Lysobacter sp. MMG2]MBU8975688.1 hypothetical protein [Lysobacter sp. MMG2]